MSEAKKIKSPKVQPGATGDAQPEDSHMTGEPTVEPLDSHMTGEPAVKPTDSHMTGPDPR